MLKRIKKENEPKRKKFNEMNPVEKIQFLQSIVIYLLYAAMALIIISLYIMKFNFIEFTAGVILLVFFAIELFILPPIGMLMMCLLVVVVFCILPYLFLTIVALIQASMLLCIVCAGLSWVLSGVVISVANGVIVSVTSIVTAAPILFASTAMLATSAIGYGVKEGTKNVINNVSEQAVSHRSQGSAKFFLRIICNLLIFLIIGWPGITYSCAINGSLACKPAVIMSQAHMNYLNVNSLKKYRKWFEDDLISRDNYWPFENHFYAKHINSGNNNITQGSDNFITSNDKYVATVLNDLLYICDLKGEANYVAGYYVKPTDALVLVDDEAFIFGKNKVFVCGNLGAYTWKRTKWTSNFQKLTKEEQYEHLYDILERQNTEEPMKFHIDEVAVVAYAQRTGMLIDYNEHNHEALFAQRNSDDSVTIYLQSEAGSRQKQTTFTPSWPKGSVPYVMTQDGGILYLKEQQVFYLYPTKEGEWSEIVTFAHPEENGKVDKFNVLLYADLGENGIYSAYLDENNELWVDTRPSGGTTVERTDWKIDKTKVSGFAGEYLYSIQYDEDIITKLTYINDLKNTDDTEENRWEFVEIWCENWHYQRMKMDKSVLVK